MSDFAVLFFIADHHIVSIKLDGLLYQQLGTVVGCKQLYLEHVSVLPDDVKGLSSDRACRAEYGYMSFLHDS